MKWALVRIFGIISTVTQSSILVSLSYQLTGLHEQATAFTFCMPSGIEVTEVEMLRFSLELRRVDIIRSGGVRRILGTKGLCENAREQSP